MAGRRLRVVLAAALSLTPVVALAQPVQPEPRPTDVALPRSPFVDIRLSPDLGDAGLRVRAALARLPVRIAEPADYELTTKRNFPQTLIAIDVRQLPQDWGTDFSAATDEPGQVPRTFELGNFVLGDYRGGLRNLVARAARAKALLALESPGGAVGIDTCVAWSEQRDGNLVGPPCHVPPGDRTVWGNDSNHRDLFSVEVRNSTAAPRYVAVLTVEPWLGVQRLVLGGTSPETPLAPGEIAKSGIIELLHYWSERFFLVTLASDRPIDPSAFLQPTLDMDSQLGCGDETSSCPPSIAIAADTQGWSVSVAEYVVDRERLAAIGGGASVLDGMALWMAAIYSTVPYTRSEIAADALRPVNEREHLAERNPRELAHRCGASLIAPNLVLTAAHCVAKGRYAGEGMARVMSERRVRIGTPYLGRGGTTYAIAGVAVPAAYLPGNQNHDIALLLIKPDRDTHLRERPTIPLGSRSLNAGTRLTAFGWGYTGSVAPGADPMFNLAEELQRNPDRLQFGEMAVLDWGKCRRRLAARLARGMVCMVAPGADVGPTPERNVFTCRGDSGGPLVRKVGETEELVGVTSWSMGCGYRDYPSVYTDVTKYGRWIAAARQQLVPGAAIRVDERAAPSREEGRPQSR